MGRIDLHIHTNCSDGKFTPKQILDIAKGNGVRLISITDHDSVEAYSPELFKYAERLGIKLIKGVEISTKFNGVGIHVLGYGVDLRNEKMLNVLNNSKNARIKYLCDVANKLEELGYVIDVNNLLLNPVVTKAHIAQAVIREEKNKELLIRTFREIPTKGNFIETIMNEGCPAYVKKFGISPIEASKIIKEAGGKVVLAHPVAYVHEDNVSVQFIEDLVQKMKADGIEANYLYINRNGQLINEIDLWNDLAEKNNLFVTTGSDFHDFDEIHPQIGFANYSIEFKEVKLERII